MEASSLATVAVSPTDPNSTPATHVEEEEETPAAAVTVEQTDPYPAPAPPSITFSSSFSSSSSSSSSQQSVTPESSNAFSSSYSSSKKESSSGRKIGQFMALRKDVKEMMTRDVEPDADSPAAVALAQVKLQSQKFQGQLDIQESKKLKVEGTKVSQGHSKYAVTYGMILGIRESIRSQFSSSQSPSPSKTGGNEGAQGVEREEGKEGKEEEEKEEREEKEDEEIRLMPADFVWSRETQFPPEGSKIALKTTNARDKYATATLAAPSLEPTSNITSSKSSSNHSSISISSSSNITSNNKSSSSSNNSISSNNSSSNSNNSSNNHTFSTPPHQLGFTFYFKAYMPKVFHVLRHTNGVDDNDFLISVAGDFNFIEFVSNSKSGEFFFYSHDGKYMVKTIKRKEARFLRQIMPKLAEHMVTSPNSLLCSYYGLYRVRMPALGLSYYFIVMPSIFSSSLRIHAKYDLKGSTLGRFTTEEAAANGAILKDLNLVQQKPSQSIALSEENAAIFSKTLCADLALLTDIGCIDYSLLVGIHKEAKEEKHHHHQQEQEQEQEKEEEEQQHSTQQENAGVHLTTAMQVMKAKYHHSNEEGEELELELEAGEVSKYRRNEANFFRRYHGGVRSVPGNAEIYFLGIIDILQTYRTKKCIESYVKCVFQCVPRRSISAVEPGMYAPRMRDFVMSFVGA